MKPLIVMGMGRSGTRYFADILSSHSSVLLHGEIPHSAMSKYFSLIETLDIENSRDKVRERKWKERKGGFILDAFSSMAMGGGREKSGYLYVGHKTPRSEKFFHLYEKHFLSSGLTPIYFYCIRNPYDVWASYKNMPWNSFKNTHAFIDAYLSSYSQYEKCVDLAKDRVQLLNLDAYKRGDESRGFINDNIFNYLGLEVDDVFVRGLLSKENRNSSESFLGRGVASNSDKEIREIKNNAGMMRVMNKHFPWLV